MEPSIIYQDNMSAILLKNNGNGSSSKPMKHIKVKYFFVKDKIDNGEISLEHCPTDQMWTDINTKPKQGLVYCVFRGHVWVSQPTTRIQTMLARSPYPPTCRCYP